MLPIGPAYGEGLLMAASQLLVWLGGATYDPLLHKEAFVSLYSSPIFSAIPGMTWNTLLLLAWLVPATWIGARYRRNRKKFLHLARGAACRDETLLAIVNDWRQRFRIRRPVQLVVSDRAEMPFTVNIWRPVVVLPANLIGQLPLRQLEAVIAHEIAHVNRLDDLWLRLETVLACLFFFHPVAWLSRNVLHRTREILTDRLVLMTNHVAPRTYALSLLHLIKRDGHYPPVRVAAGYVGGHARYRERIEHLRRIEAGETAWDSRVVVALFLLVFIGILQSLPNAVPIRDYTSAVIDADLASLSSRAVSPISGATLMSSFGPRHIDRRPAHFHTGIDLEAPVGSSVVATLPGVVESAVRAHTDETSMLFGGYIVIRHAEGLRSTYSPVENFVVEPGRFVAAGETVGTLAKLLITPQVSHLHVEMTIQEQLLDPELIVTIERNLGSE
ncbi:MAG: peptidoglycan DD-metalloendopeptidase family protein [Gammaproteobacteria bacterium]|nr:peptidoglycan DD-metalloendopeptidase family protein [Gammaproteobacteria bacterium]